MSRSLQRSLQIGCPRCDASVRATIPDGPGLRPVDEGGRNRLRGRGTECDNCGHELEVYFY